jgi:hypothetical protein
VNKWTFSVERTSCRKHWKTFFKIALLSILKAYFFSIAIIQYLLDCSFNGF